VIVKPNRKGAKTQRIDPSPTRLRPPDRGASTTGEAVTQQSADSEPVQSSAFASSPPGGFLACLPQPCSHRTWTRRRFLAASALVAGTGGLSRAVAADLPPFEVEAGRPVFLLEGSTLEDSWRVRRKLTPLVKSPRNPVLVQDRDWEGNGPALMGSVLHDPKDGLFKCWYQVFDTEAYREARPGSYLICYAVSDDGWVWRKPELDLVAWRGSRKNNIVRLGRVYAAGIDVDLAPPGSGAPARFVACYLDQPGICIAYSDDGVVWTEHAGNPVEPHHSDDLNNLVWDAPRRRWLLYHRPPLYAGNWKRRRSVMESPDLRTWTNSRTVLLPDEADFPELMMMTVFQRGNLFFGQLSHYDSSRGSNQIEIVFSSDGYAWHRVPPRERFITQGPAGDFDGDSIFVASDPVVVGDELRFYYSGFEGDHERLFPYYNIAIGAGSVRLDRLFGMVVATDRAPGALLTRVLRLPSGTLTVNADVRGACQAALLDASGDELPGFGFADCRPLAGDSLAHRVSWKGGSDLAAAAGKPVRLKLQMEDATFYAFTVR
jgi:hypothetical protein